MTRYPVADTIDMIELFAAEIGARIKLVDPGEEQEAALQARYFAEEEAEVDPADTAAAPADRDCHGTRRPRQDLVCSTGSVRPNVVAG